MVSMKLMTVEPLTCRFFDEYSKFAGELVHDPDCKLPAGQLCLVPMPSRPPQHPSADSAA